MYMVLSDVTNKSVGIYNVADVACILSPLYPGTLLPATVVIIPVGDTFRIRQPNESAIYNVLSDATNTLDGLDNVADVACILSPLYPCTPVPATVVIIPLSDTLRIRLLKKSAMYIVLSDVTNTLVVLLILAEIACILSPLYPYPPVPATVLIIPGI